MFVSWRHVFVIIFCHFFRRMGPSFVAAQREARQSKPPHAEGKKKKEKGNTRKNPPTALLPLLAAATV